MRGDADDVALGDTRGSDPTTVLPEPVGHAGLEVGKMFRGLRIQRAVLRTLFEAERRGHRSITFPALGTGVGGVPHGLGARLTFEAIRTFASFSPRHCRSIRIAVSTPEVLAQWTTGLLALDADAVHR